MSLLLLEEAYPVLSLLERASSVSGDEDLSLYVLRLELLLDGGRSHVGLSLAIPELDSIGESINSLISTKTSKNTGLLIKHGLVSSSNCCWKLVSVLWFSN